jgi:hypothetical protein
MGSEQGPVPWTKRRHHYARDDLASSLTQSLAGYGPDNYIVQPAEHVRFAVQILRGRRPSPSLVASIPLGSAPARRLLLDNGWDRVAVGHTFYARRTFAQAAGAVAAILEAYTIVYGAVGDDKGWNIVAPALRPRTPWPEPWTGEEEPVEPDDGIGPASTASIRWGGTWEIRTKPARAVFGVAVGLFCAWAALQSFTRSAGATIEPGPRIAVVIGCVVLSATVAISGFSDAIVRRGQYMWGNSISARALITFAFASVPAIIWAIVLIRLSASR